ncbi:unnamed protein product [Angiostrongylus costaricensis]|uniref:C2H2-type domain-containing protein n=1 Tax=Angiostrongylus costaricensis TaxID=334426 RepID=A0A158PDY6_ANGCS|nr:unnamed protein product [Angiostrongylus costaricensis]
MKPYKKMLQIVENMLHPNCVLLQSQAFHAESLSSSNATYDDVRGEIDCKTVLPLSEIQTLSEQQHPCPTSAADPNKRLVKKRVRKKPLQPIRTKDRQRPFSSRSSNPEPVAQVPNLISYNSLLVNEAIKLLTSKGLHSGYIEYLRSNTDESIKRSLYEAFLSRRIHCPLCPVSAEKLANAVQYQLHMLERHSCAHLYACHFCGMVFPSLEALKIHDNCAEFDATFFENVDSSDEIQGGVPSCGPNLCVDSNGLIYGGVSSAIFRTKFLKEVVDPWESVTMKKKLNRLKRKLSDPDCIVDPDEVDVEGFINGKNFSKGDGFDFGADLKTNGYFYTAVNSKEETEYSSKLYNSSETQCECITGESEFGNGSKLACDISQKFSTNCRLYARKVLCVFAGNGIPNSRIKCWECSSTVCSIFGLRVHMAIYHGIFLKTEETSNNAEILKYIPKFTNSTTRAINASIGLTPDGCLPVNLEEKKKDALVAKLKSDQGAPPSTSSQTSSTASSIASSKSKNIEAEVETPPVIILHADSSPLEQILDCPEPPSVQIIDHVDQTSPTEATTVHDVNAPCAQDDITSSRMTPQGFSYKEVDIDEIDGFVHSTHKKYHQANSSSSSLFDALFLEEESRPISSGFAVSRLNVYGIGKLDTVLLYMINAEHKYIYAKCNFCAFRIRRDRIVAHLLSECYMAPCILCGAKLFRRSERTGHWKSHSGVMHSGQGNGRSKALTAGVDHYMQSHTSNLCCLSCKTEPLETLREHVLLIHVKESTEVVAPKPTLLRCSQIELFKDTLQEYLTPCASKGKKKEGSDCRQLENDQESDFTNPSNSGAVLPTLLENSSGDDDVMEIPTLHSDEFDRMETNDLRDGTSPSLLERQRQHSSSSNCVAPIVHNVNEGDDECMMLDVIELPTGVVSHAVAATREKKYKCSMCSQTFLRKSTCRYHEQNSHRNDIISDLCSEVYGVPLDEDSLLYICQQCAVAFEDPQRARRHICEHMKKGLAFPCEMCSSICLTQSNLHEHRQKHESGKLSYRCLNCTPNKIYHDEAAIYYHLHVDHGVPIIAFCKNCLVGSANMDRIFGHIMYRECSGGKWSNPHISVPTLLRSLGFAVASDLYFQPKDEALHTQAEKVKGRFAVPTQCSHRSFIRFGEAFTTCPEDPSKCFALVNQNRWHSYLCATNREAPGEMPSVLPETVVKKVRSENMIDMLYSRFKTSAMNCQRFADLCIGM